MYPSKFIEKFKSCENLNTCLKQLEGNPKLAVAISREHALNNHLISASQLYCFEKSEIIHSYHLKFLLNKEFLYKTQLDRFIQMASANGLIEKWYSKRRIKASQKYTERSIGVLTMENAQKLFLEWLSFLLSTIVVLLLEIFIHNRVKNSRLKIWKLIEMLIDPYRHFWLENKGSWL